MLFLRTIFEKKITMIGVENKKELKRKRKQPEVPAYLVYEMLDGMPVYYRGYKNVLNGKQTFEEIMGYGALQWLIINLLKDYFQPIFGKTHWIWSGEGGLHVSQKTNPSLDFVMIPKNAFSIKNAKNKYIDFPPKVVIEVDTKADFEALPLSPGSYYIKKTELLLDFGVEEIIWIFTQVEKVMVARPKQPWLTVDWKDEIEVMGHRFSINQIIKESESEQG